MFVIEAQASIIFCEEDFTPYARRRDAAIAKHLPLERVGGLTVHHPSLVHKADGTPYTVYTPFSKAWKQLPSPGLHIWEPPGQLPAPPTLENRGLFLTPAPCPVSMPEKQKRSTVWMPSSMIGSASIKMAAIALTWMALRPFPPTCALGCSRRIRPGPPHSRH